jgi:hypothetical protein
VAALPRLVAALTTGLDCDPPCEPGWVSCSGTTSLGTLLGLDAYGTGAGGVAEFTVMGTGSGPEILFFIDRVIDTLGSQRSAVSGWVHSNASRSVVEKTFGPYHVTYRGPASDGQLIVDPT